VRAVAVLDAGGGDADREQQHQGIDDQVALASLDLFASAIAGIAPLRGTAGRLRIQHRDRRGLGASLPFQPLRAQAIVHQLKIPLLAPARKGPVYVLPGRKPLGQHAPGTSGPHHVATGIDQQAPGVLRRRAPAAFIVEQVLDQRPFRIGQAAWIGLLGLLAPMRLGVPIARKPLGGDLDPDARAIEASLNASFLQALSESSGRAP
jgi:hypothetical protein